MTRRCEHLGENPNLMMAEVPLRNTKIK